MIILNRDEVVHLDDAGLDVHRNVGHLSAADTADCQRPFAGVGVLAASCHRLRAELRARLFPGHAL
jgi:hypothetical protein